jgi:hypothetical protein
MFYKIIKWASIGYFVNKHWVFIRVLLVSFGGVVLSQLIHAEYINYSVNVGDKSGVHISYYVKWLFWFLVIFYVVGYLAYSKRNVSKEEKISLDSEALSVGEQIINQKTEEISLHEGSKEGDVEDLLEKLKNKKELSSKAEIILSKKSGKRVNDGDF